jgi:hypothetical protein
LQSPPSSSTLTSISSAGFHPASKETPINSGFEGDGL